ncbi:GntR family transcriptional regulator [Streptomyces sp. NPDC002164]|uniref:GntR family transcriptional regulator n=1 Tax=unclassified Streptomyces TaxID=2593676 RepID=UPI0036739507
MLGEKVPGKKTSAPERKDAPERETASAREIVPMSGIASERETASAHRTVPEQSDKAVGGPSAGATSQRIAHHLREAILNGEIAPGEPIRQEKVAERFGTSRLPVREALRILEAEGLTEHRPNRGARVPRLGSHEVGVVYHMRERLEPLALAESLPHLTEDDFRALDEIQRRIEAADDLLEFLALDREFHLRSYSGCRTDHLSSVVVRLWNSTQHHRRVFMRLGGSGRRWVVNAEHRLLLEAIERRDPVDAGRVLEGHIRRTRVELSQHPEDFDG